MWLPVGASSKPKRMVQACDGCGNAGKLRCSRCKSVHYCSAACQRNAWRGHKRACLAIAASLLSSAAAAPFEEVLKVPTRGAAGWTHFVIDGQDYLAVANFFTSRPGARPSMETTSVVYKAYATPSYATPSAAAGTKLRLEALQSFTTTGAHGGGSGKRMAKTISFRLAPQPGMGSFARV